MIAYQKQFTVNIPPSDNRLTINPRFGGRRIPINREWKYELLAWGPRPKIDGKRPVWGVSGKIEYPKPMLWRSDIQNRFKLFYDEVSEWLGIDDRYVVQNGPWLKVKSEIPTPRLSGTLLVWPTYEDFIAEEVCA